MNAVGEVTVVSYVTLPVPAGHEKLASFTPATRLTATRAVTGQVAHVIPVTSRATVR